MKYHHYQTPWIARVNPPTYRGVPIPSRVHSIMTSSKISNEALCSKHKHLSRLSPLCHDICDHNSAARLILSHPDLIHQFKNLVIPTSFSRGALLAPFHSRDE